MLESTAVCGFAHFRLPRCLVGLPSTSSIERGGGGGNKEENSSWPPSANAISTTVCNEAFPVCSKSFSEPRLTPARPASPCWLRFSWSRRCLAPWAPFLITSLRPSMSRDNILSSIDRHEGYSQHNSRTMKNTPHTP